MPEAQRTSKDSPHLVNLFSGLTGSVQALRLHVRVSNLLSRAPTRLSAQSSSIQSSSSVTIALETRAPATGISSELLALLIMPFFLTQHINVQDTLDASQGLQLARPGGLASRWRAVRPESGVTALNISHVAPIW